MQNLFWMIARALGRGKITGVTDNGPVQTVQMQLSQSETRDGTPRLAEFGFSSNPPAGSDAVVMFMAGQRTNGVIVGTGHQASRPQNLAPGETMIYTQDGKKIYLTASGGIIIDANGQDITIKNAQKIRAETPRLECTGDIIDNCDTQTRTISEMREIYDNHEHGGVETGPDNTLRPNDEWQM